MPQPYSNALRALPRCEALEDRITPSVTVRFDYSFDTLGTFAAADRRAALNDVAATITANMSDSLAAIAPSAGNTWTANTWNSATNSQVSVPNLAVNANEVVIFITSGNLGAALGIAAGGAYSSSGSADWLGTVRTRGQSGVDSGTDFSTWGGLIAFNSGTNFNYNGAPSSSQYDFKSVASHEMLHIFGFGLSNPSYTRYTTTGVFTGPNVVATTGYAVALQPGETDHFANGTKFQGQVSVMTPSVSAGQVKRLGALEYAALRDIGWGSGSTSAPINAPAPTVPQTPAPIAAGPAPSATTRFVVGGGQGAASTLTGFGAQGQTTYSAVAFDGFLGGIRVATGDVTGDGVNDLVVAAGPGAGPRIVVVDGATGQQVMSFFAFDAAFNGGVYIAVADFNRDGFADIVAGAGFGGLPHVKIFSGRNPGQVLDSFLAFDAGYVGGINLATGDIDGDGTADLIVGAIGGYIATFDGAALARGNPAPLLDQVAAFESSFGGEISVAAADLNGDGYAEIIVGAASGSAPRVVALDGRNLLSRRVVYAASFFAGDVNNHSGIRVATADLDGDGREDLIAGPGARSDGAVRIYTAANGFAGSPSPWMTLQNSDWAPFGTYVG